MAISDKARTSLLQRYLMWRQPEGDVGQNRSLNKKMCRITGTQIGADDHNGQTGRAQAGRAQKWGFLFPVKLKEFSHFARYVPRSR